MPPAVIFLIAIPVRKPGPISFPSPGIGLDPPSRLGLSAPPVGKGFLQLRHGVRTLLVRLGNLLVKRHKVSVLLTDKAVQGRFVLERQS